MLNVNNGSHNAHPVLRREEEIPHVRPRELLRVSNSRAARVTPVPQDRCSQNIYKPRQVESNHPLHERMATSSTISPTDNTANSPGVKFRRAASAPLTRPNPYKSSLPTIPEQPEPHGAQSDNKAEDIAICNKRANDQARPSLEKATPPNKEKTKQSADVIKSEAAEALSDIPKAIPAGSLQAQLLQSGLSAINYFQQHLLSFKSKVAPENLEFTSPKFNEKISDAISEIKGIYDLYQTLCQNTPHIGDSISRLTPPPKADRLIITQCQFLNIHRGQAALMIGKCYRDIREVLSAVICRDDTEEYHFAALMKSFITSHSMFLECMIESRLRDIDAINNVDFRVPNIKAKSRRQHRIEGAKVPELKEPRIHEPFLNEGVNKLCTAFASAEIFARQHPKAKTLFITTARENLFKQIDRYREEARTPGYQLSCVTDSLIEEHLFYAELIHAAVAANHWNTATIALKKISQRIAPPDPSIASIVDEVISDTATVETITRHWEILKTQSQRSRRYPLACHLALGLEAASQYINHIILQTEKEGLTQTRLMKIGELQELVCHLEVWAETMADYGLLAGHESEFDKSYQLLIAAKQTLQDMTRKNELALANCFQAIEDAIAQEETEKEQRQHRHKKQNLPDLLSSIQEQADEAPSCEEHAASTEQKGTLCGSNESPKRLKEHVSPADYSPGFEAQNEGEWHQIFEGNSLRNDDVILKIINDALVTYNIEITVTGLNQRERKRLISILEPREQQSSHDALLLSFTKCCHYSAKMAQHVSECRTLTARIRPYLTTILVQNTLSSHDAAIDFKKNVTQFNHFDKLAQTEFDKTCQQLTRMNRLQLNIEGEALRAKSFEAIRTTLTRNHKLQLFLSSSLLTVFKKRFEILKREYPFIRSREQKQGHDVSLHELKSNNRSLEKQKIALEEFSKPSQPYALNADSNDEMSASGKTAQVSAVNPDFFMNTLLPSLGFKHDRSLTINSRNCQIPCIQDALNKGLTDDDFLNHLANQLNITISAYKTATKHSYVTVYQEAVSDQKRSEKTDRILFETFARQPRTTAVTPEIIETRKYFHDQIANEVISMSSMGVPIAYAGSRAYQIPVEALWGSNAFVDINPKELPECIDSESVKKAVTPRDTDLLILNSHQLDDSQQYIYNKLFKSAQEKIDLQTAWEIYSSPTRQERFYSANCLSCKLILRKAGTSKPNDWIYVVDLFACTDPGLPELHILDSHKMPSGNTVLTKRIEAMILDELNLITTMAAGPPRALTAIIRITILAVLESSEPQLDNLSRMALTHALDTISQRYHDPAFSRLSDKLRSRVFNMVSHENQLWGVSINKS